MSRSYKRNPVVKDGKSGRIGKRFANKKVRRYKGEIPNGKGYKKIYESWNIHDYAFRDTYEDHRKRFEAALKAYLNGGSNNDPRDTSKWYNFKYDDNRWAKYCKRK